MVIPPEHIMYFSPKTLKLILENNGFRVVDISTKNAEHIYSANLFLHGTLKKDPYGLVNSKKIPAKLRPVTKTSYYMMVLPVASAGVLARPVLSKTHNAEGLEIVAVKK
jgi:hypothetical protein